jgi:hypothetical protein
MLQYSPLNEQSEYRVTQGFRPISLMTIKQTLARDVYSLARNIQASIRKPAE